MTNERLPNRTTAIHVLAATAAVFMLHWSLQTLAPILGWLDEPTFVQSLAAAIALTAAGILLRVAGAVRGTHRSAEPG